MMRSDSLLKSVVLALVLLVMCLNLCGCMYMANRVYDFCDVFQMGIGVTSENSDTGIWPPSLGVHAQVTEFINLGADHFNGYCAEWDGRGFFAGHESRTRLGLLPLQCIRLEQDYALGVENYFKKKDSLWTSRMNSRRMRWCRAPAKELEYDFWGEELHRGAPLFHRGWQYWENVKVEAGVCEPLITHAGIHLRLGVDPSEVSDWVFGLFMIDFKRDDMTEAEFEEYWGAAPSRAVKPPSD